METLKTTYTDAVWTGNRKYTITTNADGTASFTDVTDYTVKGTYFGAGDINSTNKQVNGISGYKSITLNANGWSSSTVTIDGSAYYTYTVSGLEIFMENPSIVLGASGTLPTTAEATNFTYIKWAVADVDAGTITFYAGQKPTTALVLLVKGVA